jgi:hypothetical protein
VVAGVGARATRLVHDLATVFIFDQQRKILRRCLVDVDRDAPNSGGSFSEDEPLSTFVVGIGEI